MTDPSTDHDDGITFEDALDDVHTRFLLNLPAEEFASADRILFQIEQAWWFYEDILCDNMTASGIECHLPRFTNMKPFALQMFQYSPLLEASQFPSMWQQFSNYKRQISNYGMILLNPEADQIVLCQTWTGTTWTLPAGKINQGESPRDSAARECYEETGFDPYGVLGYAKDIMASPSSWTIAEQALSYQEPNGGKRRTYYVCVGVPQDFPFAPVARKEVSQISWFDLNDDLPKKTFGVLPIMGKLRKWIRTHCNKDKGGKKGRAKSRNKKESTGRPKSTGRDKSATKQRRRGSSSNGRTIQNTQDPLVDAGLADIGDVNRWSEEDMFKANEALLGRRVEYDGNPHVFTEQGFGGNDPHAFRVVGGGFMNSGDGLSNITNAEVAKKHYQPLVRGGDNSVDDGDALPLTPFFTEGGETPWGEVVAEVAQGKAAPSTTSSKTTAPNAGEALLQMLQGGAIKAAAPAPAVPPNNKSSNKKKSKQQQQQPSFNSMDNEDGGDDDDDDLLDVLTDAQITKSSQARHAKNLAAMNASNKQRMLEQYEKDTAYIQQWVKQLPNPIQFRIPNVDAILEKHFG